MNYENRIREILKENLTDKAFILWTHIDNDLVNIWSKPTSSTGKYHQKENGRVPDIAEHTYEMLNAAVTLLPMFDFKKNTEDTDSLLLAIVLHDSLKYGEDGNRQHTSRTHDQDVGNMVSKNKEIFLKILTENKFAILEESVRYHSGRWSSDASKDFDFNNMNKETLLVHTLDMLSTKNLLKVGDE